MPTAEYMAQYRKKRYDERLAKIHAFLGGICKKCGKTDGLEIDHINPSQKLFEVSQKCWCMEWEKLLVELVKCQLLCKECHLAKSSTAKNTHGTISARRYCRCQLCKDAYNKWMREWKKRRHQKPS